MNHHLKTTSLCILAPSICSLDSPETLLWGIRSNVRQPCDNQRKQPLWDWWSTLSVPWSSADEGCHILLSHNLSNSLSQAWGGDGEAGVLAVPPPPVPLPNPALLHLSSINHTILINSACVPGHRSPLRAQLVLLEGPSDVDASPGARFSNNIRTQRGTRRSQVSCIDATCDSLICTERGDVADPDAWQLKQD